MSNAMELVLWLRNHSGVPMLIVFLLILVSTYAPRRKARIERNALIPLRDDR